MKSSSRPAPLGLALAALLPLVACGAQWLLWSHIPPLTWLLFYPAAFFGAWAGGFYGGLLATGLSAGLASFVFISPQLSWAIADQRHFISIGIFVAMGLLFSLIHQRLIASQAELRRLHDLNLEDRQQRLAFALHGANVGLWEWNVRTGENDWSDNLYGLYGLPPHGCAPTCDNWLATVHPEDRPAAVAAFDAAIAACSDLTMEWRVAGTAPGAERWLMSRGQPVRDAAGALDYYRGVVIDITERKRTEEELARHRDHLQELVEARTRALAKQELLMGTVMKLLPVGVWIGDEQGKLVFANDASQRIWTGAHRVGPERYGVCQGWRASTGEPIAPQDWAVARAIRHGETALDEVIEIACLDGSRKTILHSAIPLRDERQAIVGAIAVNQDITELKRVEQALSQAKDAAEAANRAKSAFLAKMSHEIRTPLNAVLGFCYLLEQHPLEAAARDLVRKIHNAGRSLLALINDILDFSKVEAGRLEIEHAPFRLSGLLDDLAGIMSAAARDKDLELTITPPADGELDMLIGDSLRLQQVLVNLLGNAIKFTERGEVELRIECVAGDGQEAALRFAVRDTGIGISAEQQTEIFSAFAQADNSISRRFGGTGLGLAISAQLVALMGGTLRVESAVARGSEFWFVLPLQRDPRATQTAMDLSRLELLVADDCATTGNAMANIAASLGWKAEVADSGETALARALARLNGTRFYDALLLDWKMPGWDGLSTAKAIGDALRDRRGASRAPPVVIMVTAYSHDELLAQPGIDVVDAVLEKPVTPSALYNAVAGALRKRSADAPRARAQTSAAGPARIPGVRVLVVDDSDLNREVAQGILEGDGAIVHTAADGQEAVDWLRANPDGADIVLMDVQMPRLNGFEATRRIREDGRFADLPIVALTAGAFQEIREAAHACGMNDFIAKPFDIEQTMALIRHWSGCRPRSAATGQSAVAAHAESPPPVDSGGLALPGIDLEQGLTHWRNPDAYRTYLKRFVDSYVGAAFALEGYCEQGDLAAAEDLAHKLNGIAGTLSLPRVASLARQLDARLRAGEPVAGLVADLQSAIAEVCTSVVHWTPEGAPHGCANGPDLQDDREACSASGAPVNPA